MLLKDAIVTVIPGIAGREYRAASETCVSVPPPGVGGDSGTPPSGTPPPSGIAVPDGTPIILEDSNGVGGYTSYTGVAPAPAGFVCRNETIMVTDYSDPMHASMTYYVVCTRD